MPRGHVGGGHSRRMERQEQRRADAPHPPPPRVFEHREEAGAGRSRAGREGRKLARLGARMRLVLKAAPMAWHLVSWEARGSW